MTSFTPSDEDFAALEVRVLREIDARTTRRRRRHRLIAAGGAALIAAGAVGTAWVIVAGPVLQNNSAYCYASASVDSPFTQVGSPTEKATGGHDIDLTRSRSSAHFAEELCASVWALGVLHDGHRAVPDESGARDPVPPLQACLRSDQVFAVFPRTAGDDRSASGFCTALGLEPPPR